ncbi:LpqB family beta-propeller domain-containing protein [Nonomuraea gerenzanensis]|uniref:LpqB n=1 Tax=Nonomuraea gerenzanensis TaxID=93944 RepID=A0A1M4E0X5_9ACTN|nr:LpqB family beta-propeller domain-containing protein [Nonomuraea gerenzanensis]UBU14732.1 LpqB family beta-propeller domain-containing protein [Nonomuraea gerenzanensis]SBO92457.1 LpqB [Nonomuraea gerenzanensis]
MTRSRRLATAFAIVAAMVAGGSGCTVIPVTGPYTVNNDEGGGDPLNKPFQRMIAIPPQPQWGAEDTIRGLQAAMAAYQDDPSILARYLTAEARAKWSAAGPVRVIQDAYEVTVPPPRESETSMKVTFKAHMAALINEDDSYKPTAGLWERPFELVKMPDGYRVSSLPPGLLLTESDVARAYRPTNLYYVNRSTQDRLVVDQVRLRLNTTETFAQTVLERLLQPPTESLRGAVTSSFPSDTKIESIRSGEDRVIINLSGSLDTLDLSAEETLRGQIRNSLNKNEVAKGRIIEILVDGEAYTVDRPDSDDQWLDDDVGDSAYYVDKGAVHYLTKDGRGGAVAGAAGEQREGYSHFAVSAGPNPLIAAKTSTGISVAGLVAEGVWQEVIQGADLTPPTWNRDGSLWTYDGKNGVLLKYDPARTRVEPVEVPEELDKLDVKQFRIARDGVRVAVTTGENTVQIGALTGEGAGTKLGNLQFLTTTESENEIRDIAWRDDENLLVLVQASAGQTLNEINVGDGETVGVPLKDRLQSVAAFQDQVLADVVTQGGTKLMALNLDQQAWDVKIESNAGTPLFPLG